MNKKVFRKISFLIVLILIISCSDKKIIQLPIEATTPKNPMINKLVSSNLELNKVFVSNVFEYKLNMSYGETAIELKPDLFDSGDLIVASIVRESSEKVPMVSREGIYKVDLYQGKNTIIMEIFSKDSTVSNKYTFQIEKPKWEKISDGEFVNRDGQSVVEFNDKLWMFGGWTSQNGGSTTNNEIWNSVDGVTWDFIGNAPWPPRHLVNVVVCKGKLWLLSGDGYEDVWNSEDGVTWNLVLEKAPWGKRYSPYVLSYNNKLWLMGGISHWDTEGNYSNYINKPYNDVWSSDNGETWNRVTENALWSPRGLIHGSIVFDGKMWIIGGGNKGNLPGEGYDSTISEYNDVWWTYDGRNWYLATLRAPWAARTHFSVAVFDNKIWISDGSVNTQVNSVNDVWFSSDGVSWIELKGTPWGNRHASSLIEFKGELLIIAGYLWSDVWKLNVREGLENN